MSARTKPQAPEILSVAAAISEGGILADGFRGTTWDRWRAVLKAANAEPMTEHEIALFREVAERDPPTRRVREVWFIIGRRGGKDSVASAIATAAALGDYSGFLRPGERASIVCLASDKQQARIIHRYIRGNLQSDPSLAALIERETEETLELSNGVEVIISTNSYRAVRGRAVVCAILDEVGLWRNEESATPDVETYNALAPGLETLPNSMLIGISTPYKRAGLLYEKWQQSYGKDDPDVLVIKGTTRQFNENIRQNVIDSAMARDPDAASAEWLAEWRNDLSDFLDRELVESAVEHGRTVRPFDPQRQYVAFADVGGGRGDSFTAAIAHAEGDRLLLDALYERRSPYNPSDVVAEVADLLRSYRLGNITGDKYAAEWVVDGFEKAGIRYDGTPQDRSALYLNTLPLFTSGRLRLLDNPRLVHQFCSLQRRTTRLGRDRVDHPVGAHDDLCNAAAGALVLAADASAPALMSTSDLLVRDEPVAIPRLTDILLSVTCPGTNGTAATVYFSQNNYVSVPLVILDFEVAQMGALTFQRAQDRLFELAKACMPRLGALVYGAPGIEAYGRAIGGIEVIEPEYLADPARLAMSASIHVGLGRVKLSERAVERANSYPLAAALQMQVGDPLDGRDPLRLALVVGIVLALHWC